VTIARQLIARKFARRPVTLLGVAFAKAEPRNVDVTVTGPPEIINGLRDEMIVPRADLHAAGIDTQAQRHGGAVVSVQLDLANVEVEIQPPTINATW
jgi:hypothetical protein